MIPPPGPQPQTHADLQRGRRPQTVGGGRTNPRTYPKIGRGDGSGTLQRGRGRQLMGWKESEALATCATPEKPDDIPDPTPPGGSMGRIYGGPSE